MNSNIDQRWLTIGGIRFVAVKDDPFADNCKMCDLRGPCADTMVALAVAERGAGVECLLDEVHYEAEVRDV